MATSGDAEMATSGEEELMLEYYYLPYESDKFEGVIVGDLSYYASTGAQYSFTEALAHSLDLWRTKGKKGVWLKIPNEYSQFVPPAIQAGLKFHHANDSYAMLVDWLSTEENTLPEYATHHISAGAFVLDENNKQMLAVMEKFGEFQGIWKMPTGVIKQGEHIFDGIKREVKEETGIETEFVEVIGFSESPKPRGKFGKSDVFFLCILRALSSEIKVQKAELVGAQWMDLEKYRNQEYLINPKQGKEKPLLVKMANASIEAANTLAHKGLRPEDVKAGVGRHPLYFYNNSG